ncbi:hypothetical protein CHARACLAT_018525 [Characodon lateralis]|uniref:Uncharacterized protein n=1 Tax=Characodon lateralis TaxID=208331 RepID=A0ABU7DW90_9TELE|nr:hypothetical protein [Characodon lateralis]
MEKVLHLRLVLLDFNLQTLPQRLVLMQSSVSLFMNVLTKRIPPGDLRPQPLLLGMQSAAGPFRRSSQQKEAAGQTNQIRPVISVRLLTGGTTSFTSVKTKELITEVRKGYGEHKAKYTMRRSKEYRTAGIWDLFNKESIC